MFSNAVISFLIALGFGTWVYNKLMHQTGSNTKNSLIGAAITGGIVFLIAVTLMGMFIKR